MSHLHDVVHSIERNLGWSVSTAEQGGDPMGHGGSCFWQGDVIGSKIGNLLNLPLRCAASMRSSSSVFPNVVIDWLAMDLSRLATCS